jgi:hypothetical protein
MNPHVETSYVRLELLDSGILVATYKKRALFTLEMAIDVVATRLSFAGRDPRPVLIYNQGVAEFARDARTYVSTRDGLVGIKAAAFMVDKLSTAFILRLILALERPPIPVKPCTTERQAMAWLEDFL